MALTYETFTFAPIAAITLVDRFVQLRGTGGSFPAPLGALRFQLTAQVAQGSSIALEPPIVLRGQTNYTGVYRFANEATIGDSPVISIPAGRYTLRITSDFYQDAALDVDWPTDPAAPPVVPLLPGYTYPFPDLSLPRNTLTLLRGGIFQPGGGAIPISGVMVSVVSPVNNWPFASCRTDNSGNWVVVIPLGRTAQAFNATLHFALPSDGLFDVPGVPVQPGAENTLSQTALRGAVLSMTGAPIRNAVITVANVAGSARSDSDGKWSFYMSLLQPDVQTRVTATAPNGRSQTQDIEIRNRATVIVPAFRIAIN
jgi:hypothetical protein